MNRTSFRFANENRVRTPLVAQGLSRKLTTLNGAKEEVKTSITSYQLGRQIGRGAYSTVCMATYKPTKETVAIKTYDKMKLTDIQKRSNIRREIKILEKLDHPRIPRAVSPHCQ